MKLYRKIEEELKKWLDSNYGLMVYGSRQVGKTYILTNFLKEHFNDFYYLNLYENVDAIEVLTKAKDTKDFILRLSALSNQSILDNTCIFIDEIQEYYNYLEKHPEIEKYYDLLTGSKFIVQNTNNKIVFSGSLLRLEMNHIISNPAGYILPLEMYPLDFEEFLIASGINQELIEIVKESFKTKKDVPDYIHEKMMDLFEKYLLVGGMPNAISEFFDNNSFVSVENAHKTIDHFIRLDISKYAGDNEKLKIQEIYDLIPSQLNKISKRFILSDIPNYDKHDNLQLSFTWLNKAGVTIPVYIASNPKIPLMASSNRNRLKLFHEDVGIFTYLLMDASIKTDILNGNLNINYGSIYESVVAQLLHGHGFNYLYYFNNKKQGEVDFLIEYKNKVIPIEIKSGKDYKRHNALKNLLNNKEYDIDEAYVFCNENITIQDNITYYPIYMIDLLRK